MYGYMVATLEENCNFKTLSAVYKKGGYFLCMCTCLKYTEKITRIFFSKLLLYKEICTNLRWDTLYFIYKWIYLKKLAFCDTFCTLLINWSFFCFFTACRFNEINFIPPNKGIFLKKMNAVRVDLGYISTNGRHSLFRESLMVSK